MDKVLELFDTYRCHLKRNDISMSDFLKQNYSNYIDDLKASVLGLTSSPGVVRMQETG